MKTYLTPDQQAWVKKTCHELVIRANGAFQAGFWNYQDILRQMKDSGNVTSEGKASSGYSSIFNQLQECSVAILERQEVYANIANLRFLASTSFPENFTPERLRNAKEEARAVLEAQFGQRTPEMGLPPELAAWPEPESVEAEVINPLNGSKKSWLIPVMSKRGVYAGNY